MTSCLRQSGPARERGFTLTEMLVVMGVMILVTAITIPAMMPFFEGQALRSGARTTQAAVVRARSLAVTRNARAALVIYPENYIRVFLDEDREWPASPSAASITASAEIGSQLNLPNATFFDTDAGSDGVDNDTDTAIDEADEEHPRSRTDPDISATAGSGDVRTIVFAPSGALSGSAATVGFSFYIVDAKGERHHRLTIVGSTGLLIIR